MRKTHHARVQRQKEFLLKDVMQLHEGHATMEKELQSYDVSRRLQLCLRAVLRVLLMHRRLCNAFVSWRSYSSRNDPWRQAEDYRRLALRSRANPLQGREMARRRIQARGFKVWVGRLKSASRSVAVLHRASTRLHHIKSAAFGRCN